MGTYIIVSRILRYVPFRSVYLVLESFGRLIGVMAGPVRPAEAEALPDWVAKFYNTKISLRS